MNVYISIVSHGHAELISELSCLPALSEHYKVIVKSNKPNDNFSSLNEMPNFYWIDEVYGQGFGHNNNVVFEFCRTNLGMVDGDYFVVLNPDVVITPNQIEKLIISMGQHNVKLAAINLFKDENKTVFDNSIRNYPSFYQFVRSFLGFGNSTILDKAIIKVPTEVDWAAGSFLSFKTEHYAQLGGFDENYFMYCEDIDICYRSNLAGERVTYFPNIRALHLAKHANRTILSKHFYWHVKSVMRFILTSFGLTRAKSSLVRAIE